MSEIVKEVVGTSFALVASLTDRHQITFQSGFADDEDDDVVNARLDRLVAFARRQTLVAEAPALREERDKLLDEQVQRRADEVEADALHDAKLAEITQLRDSTHDAGYNEHVRSGKQSAYAPRGAAKATILNCQKDLERMVAEREAHMQQRAVYHQRVDAHVAAIEAKLAEAEKLGAT